MTETPDRIDSSQAHNTTHQFVGISPNPLLRCLEDSEQCLPPSLSNPHPAAIIEVLTAGEEYE